MMVMARSIDGISGPRQDRITATETINGVPHIVVLERIGSAWYRQVRIVPENVGDLAPVDPSVFLG